MAVGTVGKKALEAINELVRRGVSPNEIYRKTGYKRGIDGKWLDMSQEARMGRAKEQGFDYVRATATDTPDTGAGYTMWAKADDIDEMSDRLSSTYGENVWLSKGDDSVDISELRDYITEYFDEIGIAEEYGVSAADLAEEAMPDDIVDSAGLWDNPDIALKLWEDVLEPKGIGAVRTPDGLVRFNPEGIRSVKAAFDPAAKESSNLLASAAPFAVGTGLAGLAASPDSAMAASTGTIEAPAAPWLVDAANYMRRLELPIVGRPLEGLADWAEGAAYQDPDRLKRAAIGALDLM